MLFSRSDELNNTICLSKQFKYIYKLSKEKDGRFCLMPNNPFFYIIDNEDFNDCYTHIYMNECK